MFRTIWILLTLLILGTFGGITRVVNLEDDPNIILYQRFGVYTLADSPFKGTEPANIVYNINFTCEQNNNITDNWAFGEIVVFHYSLKGQLGYGNSQYCCSSQLFIQGKCSNLNGLIINVDLQPINNQGKLFYQNLTKSDYVNDEAFLREKDYLETTGIWYIYIANCRQETIGSSLILNGQVVWKNPYGYLSGQILGYLLFFWILGIFYTVVGAVWIAASAIHFRELVLFQHAITLVFIVSIIEYFLWATDYTIYNKHGNVSTVVNVLAALFTASKLTSIRVLMLLVSIGYKITRPVLTKGYRFTILPLTLIYFILEGTYEYLAVVETAGFTLNQKWVNLDQILLMIANGIFFGWIAFEMFMTTKTLKENETQKYAMYKNLAILLIISISFSIVVLLTQLIIEAMNKQDQYFRGWWIFDCYFEFIYFFCLVFVAWVWRPTDDNSRFSYLKINDEMNEVDTKSNTTNSPLPVNESDDDKTSSDDSSSSV